MKTLAEKIHAQRFERAARQKGMAEMYGRKVPGLVADGFDGEAVASVARLAAMHAFAFLETVELMKGHD